MFLPVPFYENKGDGNQCMQVAMKSVLKYFLDKDFSLDELDRLSDRKNGFWTSTPQVANVLYELGLKVIYYSSSDLNFFLRGESFFREHFGRDAEKILKFVDFPVVSFHVKKLLKYDIFERKKLSFNEIEFHIEQGHVPLMLFDYNKLVGKEGFYQGHFVVVTGFDDQYIFYHESGPKDPEPNKKVLKSVFIDAWNANGTDNDVVIVYGKR